jgi:hypothetical protein
VTPRREPSCTAGRCPWIATENLRAIVEDVCSRGIASVLHRR